MVAPILSGRADVVYGSRFLSDQVAGCCTTGTRLAIGLTMVSNMFTNLNLDRHGDVLQGVSTRNARLVQARGKSIRIRARDHGQDRKGNARVYEVGISYSGRTYAEGKKIGWKDGVWALVCIVKYNLFR